MAYAARISTDIDIAAQWVEDTLGQVWQSGTSYLLTTEEYADLTTLLENSGEDFEIVDGTGSGELYLLLAR